MLIPAIHERKAWLFFLLLAIVGANLYFHFSTKLTLEERAISIDRAFGKVLYPVQWGIAMTKSLTTESVGSVADMVQAREENIALKAQLESQVLNLQALEELRLENGRLRQLLDFRSQERHKMLAARVVGLDPSAFFKTLILNRGSSDGVREGMAVVGIHGVLGKIFQVHETSSRVLLINDVNSRVDVVVQRSRTRAIVAGSVAGGLYLRFLPRRQDLRVGDVLVSSGLDQIYPPGMKVGTVTEISRNPHLVLEEASVDAAIDFDSIEEVLIVTDLGGRSTRASGLPSSP